MNCLRLLQMYCTRKPGPLKVIHRPVRIFINYEKSFLRSLATDFSLNVENRVAQADEIETLIKELCKNDPAIENKFNILLLQIDVMRQSGRQVPSAEFVKKHHYEFLLGCPSRSAREKYLTFLFGIEMKKQNEKKRKLLRLQAYEEKKILESQKTDKDENKMEYSLLHNAMFLRIYDKSINQMYNNRLMTAMKFGQKLVVDCSYDKYMTPREAINAAKQLTILFAENREHKDPFDLYFCNSLPETNTMMALSRNIPTIREPEFPLNIQPNSYLDLFPKENLVYLSPHSRNELTEFDHDAVYIIGCMVDKGNNEPLSTAKAKELGLKTAKFPFDRYLDWAAGSGKSLTLNQVCNILLDIKSTGDWQYALRHVPRRKLYRENSQSGIKKSMVYKGKSYTSDNVQYTKKPTPTNFHKRKQFSVSNLYDNDDTKF